MRLCLSPLRPCRSLRRPPALIAALASLAALSGAAPSGMAKEPLPLYDMHVHYNAPAWRVFDPPYVKTLFKAAGIARALVGSTPDEGTQRLAKAHPATVVPMFTPYAGDITARNWTRHPDRVLPRMRDRLAKARYAGIGEIHIYDVKDVDWTTIGEVVEIARRRGLFLHVHSKADAIERLYAMAPDLTILWAHGGLGVPAEVIDAALRKFPTLRAELSLRAIEIIPDEEDADLRPAWRRLLLAHQDRLMVGTDTYMNMAWAEYDELVAAHRRWLARLPRPVAEKIAHRNAARFIKRWYPPEEAPREP